MPVNTSVLIVGGSLNGLSAALLLAERNVPCLVVEPRPGTSIAVTNSAAFRQQSDGNLPGRGIEDEIRARDAIDDKSAYIARG